MWEGEEGTREGDFIHIDLTSESKPDIYYDAVFTIIIVISDDIIILT